jgi:hypothetical protein
VPVNRIAPAAVAPDLEWVGVAGGVLHVFQGHVGVAGGGDERDPERVRSDLAGTVELGSSSDAPHHPRRLRLVHPAFGLGGEDRAVRAALDVLLQHPDQGTGEHHTAPFAALALEAQDAMALIVAEVIDVAAERSGDP